MEEHLEAQASEHEFLERQMTMELVRGCWFVWIGVSRARGQGH